MLGERRDQLATLRRKMAALETHPAFAGVKDASPPGPLALPAGAVHEVFAETRVDGGAALGFTLAQAHSLLRPARPALLILGLKPDVQELGLPYGLGFDAFGLDPGTVVLIHTETIVELLWAIEEAVACRAVGAVVADIAYPHKALDFTASRRLSLRAASAGASVFLIRYARTREASAARFRWGVTPLESQPPPFDQKAPGRPRWRVRLEKGSLMGAGKATPEGLEFVMDWTENGFVLADNSKADDARFVGRAALPDAVAPKLGDRLSQAG